MHEMPSLVLVASHDEWTTRSLESVLAPAGFAIARAYDADQVLERSRTIRPDAVLLAGDFPDETGVSLCRRLRSEGALPLSTAVLLLTPGPVARADRAPAFEAGAWDIATFPIEATELLARLRLYTGAKRDAEVDGADADPRGVYSLTGLLRRGEEVAAQARRAAQPFACVVFQVTDDDDDGSADADGPDIARVAGVFREVGRRSDVLGRLDDLRLAVLATDTDGAGAQGLARRLAAALEPRDAAALRAGCWAAADPAEAPADPREIIRAATRAIP